MTDTSRNVQSSARIKKIYYQPLNTSSLLLQYTFLAIYLNELKNLTATGFTWWVGRKWSFAWLSKVTCKIAVSGIQKCDFLKISFKLDYRIYGPRRVNGI